MYNVLQNIQFSLQEGYSGHLVCFSSCKVYNILLSAGIFMVGVAAIQREYLSQVRVF